MVTHLRNKGDPVSFTTIIVSFFSLEMKIGLGWVGCLFYLIFYIYYYPTLVCFSMVFSLFLVINTMNECPTSD